MSSRRHRGTGPPGEPGPRTPATEEERRLFEAEMERLGGVKRLAPGPVRLIGPATRPRLRAPREGAASPSRGTEGQHSAVVGSGPALVALDRAGEAFAFAAPGVDRRAVRELEDGTRRPEAVLDLHGRKCAAAEAALASFVRLSVAAGRRVIKVVHGRGIGSGEGGPVLRQMVLDQLTRGSLSASVLALTSAPARLGGAGAAIVWLRRTRG